MNHLELNGKMYPVFWGGAAVRNFWKEVDPDTLAQVTTKIQKQNNKRKPKITDSELFDVFVPAVKWGVWGGQRYQGELGQPMSDDDVADLIYPNDMDKGFTALLYFFESMPAQRNGQEVETEKKP